MIIVTDTPVAKDVDVAVRNVIAARRDALQIEALQIEPEADHDGDPIVHVVLRHGLVEPALTTARLRELRTAIQDAALHAGERRFVHINNRFDDRQILDTGR